jgi:hypothetical protein
VHGERHREDGPARIEISAAGKRSELYYRHDQRISSAPPGGPLRTPAFTSGLRASARSR